MISADLVPILVMNAGIDLRVTNVWDYNSKYYLADTASESARMFLVSKQNGSLVVYNPLNDANYLKIVSKKPIKSYV